MISNESIRRVKDVLKRNGFTYEAMIDYNSQYFIVKIKSDPNEMDPYYAINKKTFAISHFSPAYDLSVIDKFLRHR